jgi:hypothetical protein
VFIFVTMGTYLAIRCLKTDCIIPLFICLLHSNGCTCYSIQIWQHICKVVMI